MTHQTRDAAKQGNVQKTFVPKQPNENFKKVGRDQLERWVGFMNTELYRQLTGLFRAQQASYLTLMVNPDALKKNAEQGRGLQYYQGAYNEDLLFSRFFESVKNEFERRVAAESDSSAT